MRERKPKRSSGPRGAPAFAPREGLIRGASRDGQSVRADWLPHQPEIGGVSVHETRNVTKGQGYLTEIFRAEWMPDAAAVRHVFQVVLGPREASAWHAHAGTSDRLFVNSGSVRVVLYDARQASPSFGVVNEFRFGAHRPALLVVPPGVWHGIQNLLTETSSVLNLVDHAYSYEAPDHWRLPPDSPRIPYRFPTP